MPPASRGASIGPTPEPEKGFYYRSDHFNFAKQGVPALDPDEGHRVRRQAGRLRQEGARRLHRARLSQAERRREAGLGSERRARRPEGASSPSATGSPRRDKYPEWKPGNEFRAKREAMLKHKRDAITMVADEDRDDAGAMTGDEIVALSKTAHAVRMVGAGEGRSDSGRARQGHLLLDA